MSTFRERLREVQKCKNSLVCVGLDSGRDRIPDSVFAEYPGNVALAVFEFNRRIIDSTNDIASVYKPNFAFYEAYGSDGLRALRLTLDYLSQLDSCLSLLDVKRGDIFSTGEAYAKAAFEVWRANAVTVNSWMGKDAVDPFLAYQDKGKGVFTLGETSNPSASDFQTLTFQVRGTPTLAEYAVCKAAEWGGDGVVVGATIPVEHMRRLREAAPDLVWLMPGVGAQGGDVDTALKYGYTRDGVGPVVNSSRGIIYHPWHSNPGLDYAEGAREAALELRSLCQGSS